MIKCRYIALVISMMSLSFAQCDGDSNLDGIVNIQDLVMTINHILGIELLESSNFSNSDANNDQSIDILDVVIVVNIVLSDNNQCVIRIDLSLDWEHADDLTYFDYETLNDIIYNQAPNLSNIKGILVIHKGRIVAENYYNNSSVSEYYNIWSVTKSFTSTLIGQAIDQGLIDSQSSTLNSLLPDYGQPYLESITLHNMLSMSSGYADGFVYPAWVSATTQQLEWMFYSYPGTFMYNNSACQINSHILYYRTGLTPYEFASTNLFPYLGINNPYWLDGYNNINDGSASLYLQLRDMTKLGQLYIQDGYASFSDKILSSEWIEDATSNQISTGFGGFLNNYGYLWWIPNQGYLAIGYGGQFIAIIPELDLVIGTHSSDYNVNESYMNNLLELMYNEIVPLFSSE